MLKVKILIEVPNEESIFDQKGTHFAWNSHNHYC